MDSLQNKNILVTGATGLVGINTLKRLAEMPYVNVRSVYHVKEPIIISNNISYVKADLRNYESCKKVVKGMDYILMFAARIARRSINQEHLISSLIMNYQVLEAAYHSGIEKVLWLSSATAYPISEKPLKEDDMFNGEPLDIYFPIGWMTRYCEILCKMYAEKLKRNMTTIVLRPTTVYGDFDNFDLSTSHVLSALIRKVVERNNPIEIWGTGEVKRDFIYVEDVVDACFHALEKTSKFDIFNIGLGRSYSVKELLEMILEIDNFTSAKIVYNKSQTAFYPTIEVDCTKAKKVIGFEAKTSIRDGIFKTIGWYKNNIHLFK